MDTWLISITRSPLDDSRLEPEPLRRLAAEREEPLYFGEAWFCTEVVISDVLAEAALEGASELEQSFLPHYGVPDWPVVKVEISLLIDGEIAFVE